MVGSELAGWVGDRHTTNKSPSPHGRVGTRPPKHSPPTTSPSHRPLMVGSEHFCFGTFPTAVKCHRPLMVGSERCPMIRAYLGFPSPSPHGRVGTCLLIASSPNLPVSPSPHGRVGTTLKGKQLNKLRQVTVPSWSGRNATTRAGDFRPRPSHRPLMVGSEHHGAQKALEPQRSPSPHGRVGTALLRTFVLHRKKSPSPHGRVGTSPKGSGGR